jgi:hypothetical protein
MGEFFDRGAIKYRERATASQVFEMGAVAVAKALYKE